MSSDRFTYPYSAPQEHTAAHCTLLRAVLESESVTAAADDSRNKPTPRQHSQQFTSDLLYCSVASFQIYLFYNSV